MTPLMFIQKFKKSFCKFLLTGCVFIVLTSCFNKGDPTPVPPPPNEPACNLSGTLRGLALSPQGFPQTYDKFPEFFEEVASFNGISLKWNGAWRDDAEDGSDAGTIPLAANALTENASQHCYQPVYVFGWRAGSTLYIKVPSNDTNNWTNQDARNLYISMLVSFASTNKPPYVFLGNESNFYYEQDPADYDNWLNVYNDAYDAIKAVSPSTMVGPIFNFEHLAGQGQLNGWNTSHWDALENHDFEKVDIVGITTYPFLHYANPANIPASYLDPLMDRLNDTPIAITETGWPAENLDNFNPQWTTSTEAQVEYITRYNNMVSGKDVRFHQWLFLHAMSSTGLEWQIFGSVSLRNPSGAKYPAYNLWLEL